MELEEGETVRKGALNSVGGQEEVCGAAVGARAGLCSCDYFVALSGAFGSGLTASVSVEGHRGPLGALWSGREVVREIRVLALPLLSVQVEIFVSEGLFHGRTAAKQQVRACGHIGVLMRNLCPLRVSEQERYSVLQRRACVCLCRHVHACVLGEEQHISNYMPLSE